MTRRHPAASLPSKRYVGRTEQSSDSDDLGASQYAPEQKAEMIRRVSEAMAEAIGRAAADPTWVVIEEIQRGDWWVGGRNSANRSPSTEEGGA